MPDLVGQPGAHGDFDTFAALQHKMAQSAVKLVELPELSESDTLLKTVWLPRDGERKAVSREPIIIVMSQHMQRLGLVRNEQATFFEPL
jgi:hypothetical protein